MCILSYDLGQNKPKLLKLWIFNEQNSPENMYSSNLVYFSIVKKILIVLTLKWPKLRNFGIISGQIYPGFVKQL